MAAEFGSSGSADAIARAEPGNAPGGSNCQVTPPRRVDFGRSGYSWRTMMLSVWPWNLSFLAVGLESGRKLSASSGFLL
jgi:hypothetical protein